MAKKAEPKKVEKAVKVVKQTEPKKAAPKTEKAPKITAETVAALAPKKQKVELVPDVPSLEIGKHYKFSDGTMGTITSLATANLHSIHNGCIVDTETVLESGCTGTEMTMGQIMAALG